MASPVFIPIQNYITIARISQYLMNVDFDTQQKLQGGMLNTNYVRLLHVVREGVEFAYSQNPNDPTLNDTGLYMYSLCGRYAQQAALIASQQNQTPPVISISNPSNQSVNVGQTAIFSVTVTTTLSYSIQWFLNGVAIPGATGLTYSVVNAQLSQSGGLYSATATASIGSVSSTQATLTVTQAEVGYYYQGVTDYSTQLLANTDNVVYLGIFPITTGQPFTVTFPFLISTDYIVVKYPNTEPTKTTYLNPPPSGPDTGPIPDIALNNTSFGGWKYIFSRTNNPFGVNSVNGQIKFS